MANQEGVKISVVTVALNSVGSIESTIRSVAAQTYGNIEYLLLDGASTDGTLEIARSFDDVIDRLVSEKDTGIYNAMNKAIRLATGDFVYFLNADDRFADPRVVERVAEAIVAHPEVDLIYGDVEARRGNETFHCRSPKPLDRRALCRGPFCHQALFARRQLLLQTGGFDESFRVAADVDWLVRALTRDGRTMHLAFDIAVVSLEGLSGSTNWRQEKKRFLRKNFTLAERLLWRKLPKLLKLQ